jgi:hypothetical protein
VFGTGERIVVPCAAQPRIPLCRGDSFVKKVRVVTRFALPALAVAAVVGGSAASASAEPVTPQGHEDVTRELPTGDLLGGDLLGGLLGGGLLGGGLLG